MDRSLGVAVAGMPPGATTRGLDQSLSLPSTSHMAIVDRDGRMVNMTTTIENGFGSLQLVKGFLLNNQLTDFSFLPAAGGRLVANRIEPGKRPRSSMTPAIVFDADNNPVIALGSPGGPNIIGYVAQALVEMIDWGRSPGKAVAAPHILNRNGPTLIEAGTSALDLRGALEALGHEVDERQLKSGLNIVQFKDGVMIGASDPRRDGIALGE
jgi:gamma-glutamyltranspeptidase/glutathione hydrolase